MNRRTRFYYFFADGPIAELAYRLPRPWSRRVEKAHYRLERLIGKLWCPLLGHVPIPDHCGMAKHDLCGWCTAATPGGADWARQRPKKTVYPTDDYGPFYRD